MPSYRNGDTVGDYQVLKLLGRGAYGEVLLVRGPERACAMKVIPCDPEGANDTGVKAREAALAEARLLQSLRHPHIVACEEVAYDVEHHIVRLVLEYMDGGDLHGLIDSRRESGESFDAHFARRLLAAVGGALFFVHAAGVLHRDVKPANVLLSRRSHRIKLADFGIAKLAQATTLRAQTVVGTPYYWSPEIVSGEEYGPASDCWALGACLYEIVVLRRPFEASNQLALVQKICYEQQDELPQSTADDVRQVVQGLLEKKQEQRLTLAAALSMSAAISALVVSDPADIESEPISPPCSAAPHDGNHALPLSSPETADSWGGCQLMEDDELSEALDPVEIAAAAARAALGAEVDDPEELQIALLTLERERGMCNEDRSSDAAALDSLEEELRLRLRALRCEAAALLDGIMSTSRVPGDCDVGDHVQPERTVELNESQSPLNSAREELMETLTETRVLQDAFRSASGTPRANDGDTCTAEDAIEVATNLGVNTEPAEEHIASVRRMLSVRIVWQHLARFCLLPVRARFDALLRAVTGRFGLAPGTPMELCWCEGETVFPLDSQVSWEECLQRRGLAERPGRLELQVQGLLPPRQRQADMRTCKIKNNNAQTDDRGQAPAADFFVTGMQAFPAGYGPNSKVETSSRTPAPGPANRTGVHGRAVAPAITGGHAVRSGRSATNRVQGKAWAAATGRDKPIHWAPTPGGASAAADTRGTSNTSGLDLCLEGRPAATVRRP